ncbi:hypothetical protein SMSP2_01352 [Limihaloglobus sulfuriphilus]|uniref:LamG-like jellyroll fold domain-containing protein n=1 Tax=Limihaloglobus sulfuriphilus TaxID=1851148 RepID=A0A1Q2MEL8_9BACT|nr:LamG-like jellyroll fold domain-containing protein [Limihaloglobus sulfuriphilus]AQQ70988.1 hypothetical protein SMSP2_01352 [Limihaloglobus sulfuriphilus]
MRIITLTVLCCVLLAGPAYAEIAAMHQGAIDPETEGWSVFRGPFDSGSINSMGLDAWKVEDTGGSQEGGYDVALTTAQINDAQTNGWTLSARVRTPAADQSLNDAILTGVNFGSLGFILQFGATAGTPVVAFIGGPSATLTGLDDGWHLYEVIYDSATGSADLFVDGTEQISNFAGWNGTFLAGTVAFGSGSGGGSGIGYYNMVEFEVNAGNIDIGFQTQLFVDDFVIDQRQNVVRKAQQASRMDDPVMVGEYPWEESGGDKRILLYGTVLYDSLVEQYRMWYMGRIGESTSVEIPELNLPGENIHYDLTSYAVSRDGIHWDRPNLGLVHFAGDPENNIMLDFHGASVFLDPEESDPQKRYKAIGFMRRFHDIRVCYSPDGIHWSEPKQASDRYNEGAFNACYVPWLDYYVAGSIEPSTDPDHQYIDCEGDPQGKRVAVALRTGGKDLTNWVDKTYINPDAQDDPDTQFYGMTPFVYGDNCLIFGFLHVFDVIDPQACFHDGPIEAQLVYSRDGLVWHRLEDRQPVISLGPNGSYDGGMIMMTANGAFLQNDELIAYYTGTQYEHGLQGEITAGRATWSRDRLVALEAESGSGTVVTKPFILEGETLKVNVDATGGSFYVEVLDENSVPVSGFAAADANVYNNVDELNLVPQWGSISDLSTLVGQAIRLKFYLTDAKLFAFKIGTVPSYNFDDLLTFAGDWLRSDGLTITPVLHLKLEETGYAGYVTLSDSSGEGNSCNVSRVDGQVPSSVSWSDSPCPDDPVDGFGALDLSDTTNCIGISPSFALQNLGKRYLGNEATFSCWLYNYADSAVKNRGVFFHGSDSLGGTMKFQATWKNGYLWFGDTRRVLSASFNQDNYKNVWTHFVFTGDKDATAVYINGDLYATGGGIQFGFNGAHSIRIGARTDSQWNDITEALQYAVVDDIRIYDRVLTEVQIEEIMGCREGPVFYFPLCSPANISPKMGDADVFNPNNPDIVNLNDFSVLAEYWLNQN